MPSSRSCFCGLLRCRLASGRPCLALRSRTWVEDEREKKKAREAERAKALSPGGPGTGLRVRPAHPMLTRPPALLVTSSKAGGIIIDKGLADTTSSMTARPGTSMRPPTRPIRPSAMLSFNPRAALPAKANHQAVEEASRDSTSSSSTHSVLRSSSSTAVVIRPPDNKLVSKSAAMKKKSADGARSDKPQINYKTRGTNSTR